MKRSIDPSTMKQLTQSVSEDLSARHISEALDKLGILVQYSQDGQVRADLEELRANYTAMLSFLTCGGTDDNRATVQDDIARQTWALLMRVSRAVRLASADDTYSRTALGVQQEVDDTRSLMQQWAHTLPSEERFALQDTLFDYLWTSPQWSQADTALWYDFILRQDSMVQQHLLGAVFLSAWEYPDVEKLSLITLMASSDEKRTRMTAVTALVLIEQAYGQELESLGGYRPDALCTSLQSLATSVQMEIALILASKVDTELEQREIDAINSSNMALAIRQALQIKLKYVRKRLATGYDPNLSRLSTLHSSKFLGRCSHWFLPFDSTHPLAQSLALGTGGQENKALTRMTQVSADCDVDKYAMCEMIDGNKRLAQTMAEQLEQSGIGPKDAKLPDMTLKHIVQNLYRFFTQSSVCHDVRNPFASPSLLIGQERFRTQESEEMCLDCAETLQEATEYEASARILDSMQHQYGASARLLRLRGNCYERLRDIPKAYRCYTQATFLEEPDLKLALLLYRCCGKLDKKEERYTWLDKVIELTPGNNTYLHAKASLLEEDARWPDALKLYYRLVYDDPTDQVATEAIARCELMQGNLAPAQKYLEKLLAMTDTTNWQAHMLGAHLCFIQGNWEKAKAYYVTAAGKFLQKKDNTYADFLDCYEKTKTVLTANGISDQDTNLMRDALWMNLIHGL